MNPNSDKRMFQIRAAVLRKKGGPLKIESLEMEGPRNDEIMVRLVASGICHTDFVHLKEPSPSRSRLTDRQTDSSDRNSDW